MKARYAGLSILILCLSLIAPARGQFEIFPQGLSPLEQTTQADIIILGTVTDIEEQPVEAERRKGSGKVAHLVGTIRVAETLLGAKGLTHVRVGFVPGIPVIRQEGQKIFTWPSLESDWRGRANLNVGQEAIFFLERNPGNDFYAQIPYSRPLAKTDLNYESERKTVVRLLSVYADPHKALLADKAADRHFAATALVARYRAPRHSQNANQFASEPIPADESKLILETLAEMKFGETPFDPDGVFCLDNAFRQLQLTEKDGWKHPQPKMDQDPNEVLSKAAAKWLRDNACKYRIQRLIDRPQTAE